MREDFHTEMDRLVDELVSIGDTVIDMLDESVRSLIEQDVELADTVMYVDDKVDAAYVDVQNRVVRLMALQAPVASDLRLLSSMLHVNIHLERMGDYAVTIARMGKLAAQYRGVAELNAQLREMADIAMQVGRRAITAIAHRDVHVARSLPALDDGVDRLNIGIFRRLVALAAQDESRLEWATHMILVARQLERWSDHAVDIGEATIFAVTGQMVELSSNAPRDGDTATG